MAVSPSSGVSQPTHTRPPLSRQDALALDTVATNSGLDHPSVVPRWVEAVGAMMHKVALQEEAVLLPSITCQSPLAPAG